MKPGILFLLCFASIISFGQDNLLRWNDKEPLRWEDFTGKINDSSWFDAECFAEIRYNYTFYDVNNFQFDVYANFDKNTSWIRKKNMSDLLLKHEQLHFDIAELYSLKIKEIFERYNYTTDFIREIQLLFDNKKREYLLIQQLYDDETEHSINKKKQKDWESNIYNQLREMKLRQQIAWNDVGYKKGK